MTDSQDDGQPAEKEALNRYRSASRRRSAATSDRRRAGVRAAGIRLPAPGTNRDPQPLSTVFRSLSDGQGWTLPMAVWSLTHRWPEIVGPQVADHVVVESFDPTPGSAPEPQSDTLMDEGSQQHPGGTLTLRADAAVWQKQVLWNLAGLQRRIDAELGRGVVGRIIVLGPPQQRRSYGPRRVRS